MKRSDDRILTTHTGSLPRPPELLPFLLAAEPAAYSGATREVIRDAVKDAVTRQLASGVDVVSDGEMGKPGFAHYVKDRLTGFQGQASTKPFAPRDLRDYPEVARRLFVVDGKELPRPPMPTNDGPIAGGGWGQVGGGVGRRGGAIEGTEIEEAFMPAISPGC